MVFVRSNGTFAVEYDEDGSDSPKEDHIAENRLRRRLNYNDKDGGDRNGSNNNRNGSNDSNNDFGRYQDRVGIDEEYGDDFHHQDNKFEAGDMVFAQTGGWGRKNWTRVTVDAYLGKGFYRVEFVDGSGTKELDSKKLRYIMVYLVYHSFSTSHSDIAGHRPSSFGCCAQNRRSCSPPLPPTSRNLLLRNQRPDHEHVRQEM